MKKIYSLLSIFSMTLFLSNSYSQCGSSVPVSCEPTTTDLTFDYGEGLRAISIDGTGYLSNTAFVDGGYRYNPCDEFLLNPSTTYNISIQTGATYNEDVYVYIDYNNDGDFEDSGELVFTSLNQLESHGGSFTTPAFSLNEKVTIRVKTDDSVDGYGDGSPCTDSFYGQIEDFTAVLTSVIAPTASFTSSATSVCENTSISFTDTSTDNPTSWSWAIFSPSTGNVNYTSQNVNHLFTVSDNYTVTLTASNDGGSDITQQVINVTVCVTPDATTKLRDKQCGTTLSSMSSAMYCDEVVGATSYEWTLTPSGGGTPMTYSRTVLNARPSMFSGIMYNTTYDVQVRAFVDGAYTDFGPTCEITTSDYPIVNVRSQYCGITLASMTDKIYCEKAVLATNYLWEFTAQSNGQITSYESGTKLNVSPKQAGLLEGATYFVRIRPYIEGAYRTIGSNCVITTPSAALVANNVWSNNLEAFEENNFTTGDIDASNKVYKTNSISYSDNINTFPNPVNRNTNLSIIVSDVKSENVVINIRDIYGKVILSKNVTNTNDNIREYIFVDDSFASGVYFISIEDGTNIYNKRFLIN